MKFVVILALLFTVCACQQADESTEKDSAQLLENEQLLENTVSEALVNTTDKTEGVVKNTAEEAPMVEETTDLDSLSFQSIEWMDLIPADELNILLNPPEYILDIEDGSSADQLLGGIGNSEQSDNLEENLYQQTLTSTNIIESMNGKNVRIPGFIVPVDFDEQQKVTSFFLVPYFGACLHMPPPPPNQVIYVQVEQGFELESLYYAFWISGKISTETFQDEGATSAYTMKAHKIEIYEDE